MLNLGAWVPYSISVAAGGGKSNFKISPAIATGQYFEVMDLYAVTDSSTSAATAIRIGFGVSTLPVASTTEATPAVGILLDHPGAAAGLPIAAIPGKGGAGQHLLLTCEDPAGGSLIVTFLGAIRSSK